MFTMFEKEANKISKRNS